jgi:teichuronic acid biosynthesis glycosyltransferase TuaC
LRYKIAPTGCVVYNIEVFSRLNFYPEIRHDSKSKNVLLNTSEGNVVSIPMKKEDDIHLGLVGPLPPPFGGMANQNRQLFSLLQSKDVKVSLVQTNAVYKPRVVRRLKKVRAFFRLIPYLLRLWRLAGQVDMIHVLANSGWSWQLFAAPAVWVGALRGTPVIVNYRGGEARSYFEKAFRRVHPTMKKASALVVPSAYLQEIFTDFGFETTIIPNIIDLGRFKPDSKTAPFVHPTHLIVTRKLDNIYDIPTAIKAASIVRESTPGIKLSIAGNGLQEQKLRDLVEQLNMEDVVCFLGELTLDEIADLYREADIFLNPSTVDNMPNSILESFASGVPVVTTNVGGIPYLVEDERTALMVDAGDAEGMARQIKRLLTDPLLYRSLVKYGLQELEQYSWPIVIEKWLSLYRRFDRGAQNPRLLVFSSLFPHAGAKNAGVFIRERMFRVAKHLPVMVVSPQPWFPGQALIRLFRPNYRRRAPRREEQDGIEILFPRFFSIPLFFKQLDGLFMAFGAYPRLRRLKNQGRFNLLDAHFAYPDGYAATRLGKWLKVPVTVTLRGTEVPHSKKPKLRVPLVRALMDANRMFSVSESLRQHAIVLGAEPSKIQVVGNGVDTTKFHPVDRTEARRRFSLPLEAKVMISVGALVKRKGFHRVIEVLPELLEAEPDLHYLVVGGGSSEGDRRAELGQQVKKLGLEKQVHFLGVMPSDKIKWPLCAADLFVLATSNEGWANVFLEAMACGLPVITTNVGGNAEVVCRSELGMVVPFGDQQALRDALLVALGRAWDREAIRAHAEANAWDSRVACLVDEFRSIAANGYQEVSAMPSPVGRHANQ